MSHLLEVRETAWESSKRSTFSLLGRHALALTNDINSLAYAELYLVMSALFCPKGPNLKLFETDETDADLACALLLPLPKLDSKGIRVLVE
jgi:hypothetical protein